MKLLNPGPVTMTERVRRALASEDVCHREPEFGQLVADTRARLAEVYVDTKEGFTPVLLGGSGTAAVEAMLSLVGKSETSLVVANGVYGERIAAMLKAQGKAHEVITSPWTSGLDLDAADDALGRGPKDEGQKTFGHVLTVHHETTTGRLNDIAALGMIAQRHGVPMLVDAVSSFAGEEIQVLDWGIEAFAATANKCVHGAPGVSFVMAADKALKRPSGATSVYLDLSRHAAEQAKGSTPFTLPTHVTRAFHEALGELADEGGWKKRRDLYRSRSARVRSVCKESNAPLLLSEDDAYGCTLTSFKLPSGKSYEALHAALKRDGFVIYAGQGKFDGAIFRIAVMGDLSASDIDRLSSSLRSALA